MNNTLSFSVLGEAAIEISKSVTVSIIIESLHQSGQLKRKSYEEVDFTSTKILHLSEYDKYLGVMKLLQDVWKLEEAFSSKKDKKILPLSTKEKSTLINPASKAADVKNIAKRMEELALVRMRQLEDENKPNE